MTGFENFGIVEQAIAKHDFEDAMNHFEEDYADEVKVRHKGRLSNTAKKVKQQIEEEFGDDDDNF